MWANAQHLLSLQCEDAARPPNRPDRTTAAPSQLHHILLRHYSSTMLQNAHRIDCRLDACTSRAGRRQSAQAGANSGAPAAGVSQGVLPLEHTPMRMIGQHLGTAGRKQCRSQGHRRCMPAWKVSTLRPPSSSPVAAARPRSLKVHSSMHEPRLQTNADLRGSRQG